MSTVDAVSVQEDMVKQMNDLNALLEQVRPI